MLSAACQLIEAGDKIYEHTDADNDETIQLQSVELVAAGASFEIRSLDACTDQSQRCETDRIEVIDADASGPFRVEKFAGEIVTVRALEAGSGRVEVRVEMDGETASAAREVKALALTDFGLTPMCVAERSRWVAPKRRLGMRYYLFSGGQALAGSLAPPIDAALELQGLQGPSTALYQTPEALGPVSVTSKLSGSKLLELEVFGPEQATLEILPTTRLLGPTVSFQIEERIQGSRPCVESEGSMVLRSETPEVCHMGSVAKPSDEARDELARHLLVWVLRAGTCTLTAAREGHEPEVRRDFELVL